MELLQKSKQIPRGQNESLIAPIYKKDVGSCQVFRLHHYSTTTFYNSESCRENHRRIYLVGITSKLLVTIILHRPTSTRIKDVHVRIRSVSNAFSVVVITSVRLVTRRTCTLRRSTISVFFNRKSVFDSVDLEILWRCLPLRFMP